MSDDKPKKKHKGKVGDDAPTPPMGVETVAPLVAATAQACPTCGWAQPENVCGICGHQWVDA